MKKIIYSFLGLPASGKGTQAKLLAEKYNLEIIGIGDLVRAALETGDQSDPIFADMKKRYEAGALQRDEVIFDLVSHKLEAIKNGAIFDNFPFSEAQARFVDEFIARNKWFGPVIIYLKTDPETVIQRIVHRKICSDCGAIYMDSSASICDKCGGALVARSDDNEDTIRKRISVYGPMIREMIKHYAQDQHVIEIDGEKSVPEVEAEIARQIARFSTSMNE